MKRTPSYLEAEDPKQTPDLTPEERKRILRREKVAK